MPGERLDGLAAVLDAIRQSGGTTQPQLIARVGLGRSVVAQRVTELQSAGLVRQAGRGESTGGRAPRLLEIRADAGVIAGADIGATGMVVGLADVAGTLLATVDEPIDVADGPDVVLGRLEQLIDELLEQMARGAALWGIGVGVPGPVEFESGLPVTPPIMPGWDGYPIRDRLAERYRTPVWVDNDVNLLVLGELRANPAAAGVGDMLYVKIGTGIGAGLVSGGHLHRGANGCAGDIGHVAIADAERVVCRCGNFGCLEAAAGGAALARDGRRLADSGESPLLASILADSGAVTATDVTAAAQRGDPAARTLLTGAGRLVGATLATLVSFYNPDLVVLGGRVVRGGDYVLAAIREAVYRRSLPLATRSLRIELSALGDDAGLRGAVHMVLDELFAANCLARWLADASPAGRPDLTGAGGAQSVA